MTKPYLVAARNYTENPDTDIFNMHTHSTHELYCFLNGSANYYVEGNVYNLRSGDILIMKKGEAHTLLINKNVPYERIVVNFNNEALVGETASNIKKFIENRPLGRFNRYTATELKENNLHYFLKKVLETDFFAEKQLYLTLILNELCKEYPKEQEIEQKQDSFIEIVTYINSHLTDEITLNFLSEKFYISKTHLIRLFKKNTGSTVWNYLLAKRLVLARELLISGERPSTTYLKAGFNDYSSFFKAYKAKYKKSPKEDYRN